MSYKTLGELGTIITGKTPSTKESSYWNGDIPFITPKDIQTTKHIFSTERYITREGLAKVGRSTLPPGSICVSCIGNIGYVGITTKNGITNQQINSIVVSKDNDRNFVFYLLKSLWEFFKNYEGQSTTLSILNKTQFSRIMVDVPELYIQQKIGMFLSALDNKIELNEQINANLEQQAQVLIENYFDATSASAKLSDIMTFENGFAFKSKDYLSKGRYRIITIKNVQDGKIDSQGTACLNAFPSKMKEGCVLQIGDVLLSLTGNVGRVGIVCENNLLLNQRVAKVAPYKMDILPFLYFVLRRKSIKTEMESIAKGTAQLNLSPVETLCLNIPYSNESAHRLSNLLRPLYVSVIYNSIENICLATLRDELLPKLMSGEIDVSALDL